jgi:hypothetical protein
MDVFVGELVDDVLVDELDLRRPRSDLVAVDVEVVKDAGAPHLSAGWLDRMRSASSRENSRHYAMGLRCGILAEVRREH